MDASQGYETRPRDDAAMGEIVEAEARLASVIGEAIVKLDHLGERLGRVLLPPLPVDPSPGRDLAEVEPRRAEMTDFLRAQIARIEGIVVTLDDLDTRLGL